MLGWTAWLFLVLPARAEDGGRGLDVYFIDVMGGAATLIVTPERESVLIDSGWPGNEDRDPKRIVAALRAAGCERLDHLVTTHWHVDHFGGVSGLSKLVEIGHYWDRGLPEDHDPAIDYPEGPSERDPLGAAYRRASMGKRTALKPGDSLPLRGETKAVVLAAGGRVLPAAPGSAANPACAEAPSPQPTDKSDNARSLVLRFRFGKFDFLDCGDLTWNVEQALVCPSDRIGPIDLYQVTHHGMDISNNPALLKTISPTVAIMNNGPRKGGSAATVERLRAIPTIRAAYQLHRNAGTKPEENAPAELIANRGQDGGEFIHVSVRPGGERFTVQIGAAGATREFESR
ncbi:ComEC/Rec2 family competence protein [Aquisphaera insulae]|uniref:ComEC/Rec2 family competence protein n=1 Tax=Aquisphaera insulae TaxID=2712864 RepID=UPI00202E8597|nr:MBL fold metallo-hydrolase [Aquisphaera insulae]